LPFIVDVCSLPLKSALNGNSLLLKVWEKKSALERIWIQEWNSKHSPWSNLKSKWTVSLF